MFSLILIDVKALHQVGNYIFLEFSISDDLDSLINVKENGSKTVEEMELFLHLCKVELLLSDDALSSPLQPFINDLTDTHNAR